MAHVLGISGSLRRESFNTRLLGAAGELLPEGNELEVADFIGELPFFNQDTLDAGPPEAVLRLKRAVRDADAVLIATPEYNWGVPAVTKNVVDWLSRPLLENPLINKPVAVIGASTSHLGTIRAQLQLRQSLYPLGGLIILPEVVVGDAACKFSGDSFVDPVGREMLRQLMAKLVDRAEVSS